jgi:cytosine deaminase
MSADLLVKNARLLDGRTVDIAVTGGKISRLEANLETPALETKDASGRLLLPGFVEAHCHLDKNLTLERVGNASGTLMEAIENWVAYKPSLTHADYVERAKQGLELAVQNGVTALRSHVDISVVGGLIVLRAVAEARDAYRDLLEVQLVALGGAGVDDAETAIMREAMGSGADIVGGCPWITPDPDAASNAVFQLALETGKPIDLHVDETEDPAVNTLETIARLTLEHGFQGRVTVGHCCSLEFMAQPDAERVMDLVLEAQLHVVSLPACNLNLQGRGMHPAPRGLTRVSELLERGVNVCFGSDNVRDPFHPTGDYDPLKSAALGVIAAHMGGGRQMPETLEMVTARPARALGLQGYGLEVGAWADFVVLDAVTPLEALSTIPVRLAVYKRGQLVSSTRATRWTRSGGERSAAWT